MNWWEIVSYILNILFVGGGLTILITMKPTREKATHNAEKAGEEVETVKIDNDEKVSKLLMEIIVKPLKIEINALRKEVRSLQRAMDKISTCPYADTCPVKRELQNSKDSNNGD